MITRQTQLTEDIASRTPNCVVDSKMQNRTTTYSKAVLYFSSKCEMKFSLFPCQKQKFLGKNEQNLEGKCNLRSFCYNGKHIVHVGYNSCVPLCGSMILYRFERDLFLCYSICPSTNSSPASSHIHQFP